MRRAYYACVIALTALMAVLANCASPIAYEQPGGGGQVGVVNGGGGLEDLDAAPMGTMQPGSSGSASGQADASSGKTDASSGGSSGNPSSSSTSASSSTSSSAGTSSSSSTSHGGGSSSSTGSSSTSASSSTSSSSGSGSGSSSSSTSRSSSSASESGGSSDAGTGSVTLLVGGSAHLTSLAWTINGPNTYSGAVDIGDAQSIEWIVGGVEAADGYTITVTATDTDGQPCEGTSLPFNVQSGLVTTTTLTITCNGSTVTEAADVTTGSVFIEANVIIVSDAGSD